MMEQKLLGQRPEGLDSSVYVHPLSFVESNQIGESTRVWGFAHVMKGAVIGARCNVGEHAYLETGAVVGNGVTIKNGISIWDKVEIRDDAFLGPHMVFTNDLKPRSFIRRGRDSFLPTLVDQGATIGAGATIVCGTTIGRYSFVAAGAVVTKNVPPFAMVMGNPAKLVSYVCKCLETKFQINKKNPPCSKCNTPDPQSL